MSNVDQLRRYPRVGVAVIVCHQQQVLFGQRVNEAGHRQWQLPGGWIEWGESPEQAACREVKEETGLDLVEQKLVAVTNNVFVGKNHSISLYFEAKCIKADNLAVREIDKCASWVWKNWDEVTEDLFLPLKLLKNSRYRPFLTSKCAIHVSN